MESYDLKMTNILDVNIQPDRSVILVYCISFLKVYLYFLFSLGMMK